MKSGSKCSQAAGWHGLRTFRWVRWEGLVRRAEQPSAAVVNQDPGIVALTHPEKSAQSPKSFTDPQGLRTGSGEKRLRSARQEHRWLAGCEGRWAWRGRESWKKADAGGHPRFLIRELELLPENQRRPF